MEEDALHRRLSTLVGEPSRTTRAAPDPVSAAQVRRWREAFGEDGPADIVPRAMLAVFTSRGLCETAAAGEAEGSTTRFIAELGLRPAGVGIAQRTLRDLRIGDMLIETNEVESVSLRKATKLGAGYFVTILTRFADENGTSVGEQRINLLAYSPDLTPPPPMPQAGTPVPPADLAEEALPSLRVRLDRLGVIACTTACGDFAAGHYDPDIARGSGFEDIFTDVYAGIGFTHRFVGGWAGASARVEEIDLKLGSSFYASDTLSLAGAVIARDDTCATVGVRGLCRTGLHIAGTARVAL